MKEILVKNLMKQEISCLPPETPLQQVVKKMVEQRCSYIVINKDEKPIGIVTERDLVKVLNQKAEDIDFSLPASDVMSSPIVTLNENENLFDAMVVGQTEKIRHIPVVNDNQKLVGIITYAEIVNAHFHVIEIQSELIDKEVAQRTGSLQLLNEELQALSMEDHLMKIGNRRSMEVDLGHTHSAALRYKTRYSILLIDIDFFKKYNDFYGHQTGDDALKTVAKLLKGNVRDSDRLYRYGGEEILLLMPHTDDLQTEIVARKLIKLLAKSAIPHEKSPYEYLTISCGGACVMNDGHLATTWEELIEKADQNLYEAKNDGRNRSVVS